MTYLLVLAGGILVGIAGTLLLLDSEWWTGRPAPEPWRTDLGSYVLREDGTIGWTSTDTLESVTILEPAYPAAIAHSVPRLLPGEVAASECEYCSHGEHYPEPCHASVPWGPGDLRPCDCLDTATPEVRSLLNRARTDLPGGAADDYR